MGCHAHPHTYKLGAVLGPPHCCYYLFSPLSHCDTCVRDRPFTSRGVTATAVRAHALSPVALAEWQTNCLIYNAGRGHAFGECQNRWARCLGQFWLIWDSENLGALLVGQLWVWDCAIWELEKSAELPPEAARTDFRTRVAI